TVPRGPPEFCERRRNGQRPVESYEAFEDLLRNRSPVDVSNSGGIERHRLVAQRPSVRAGGFASLRRLRRLRRPGPTRKRKQQQRGNRSEEDDASSPPQAWAVSCFLRAGSYQPPPSPSAVPIAWNTCVELDVPDSITGAANSNATSARTAHASFVIA